jgi:hypothetical protein
MAALDDGAIDHRQTIAALQRELDQCTAERDEALAQQLATSEILGACPGNGKKRSGQGAGSSIR